MPKTEINKKHFSKVYDGKGFTLLELIVVMAILSILASLSVPRFIDLSARAGKKHLEWQWKS